MPILHTIRIADLSTGHVTPEDRRLMLVDEADFVPQRSHLSVGGYGAMFYTPTLHDNFDPAIFTENMRVWGFSEAFCRIILLAAEQGLEYVNFDADGVILPDLPLFGDDGRLVPPEA